MSTSFLVSLLAFGHGMSTMLGKVVGYWTSWFMNGRNR